MLMYDYHKQMCFATCFEGIKLQILDSFQHDAVASKQYTKMDMLR